MKNIHRNLQKGTALLLAGILLFSLTACGESNDLILHRGKQDVIRQEVDQLSGDMQSIIAELDTQINNRNREAYETALTQLQTCCQSLIDDYHALANQVPPSEYSEQQKELKRYADDIELMLSDTLRMYTLAQARITGAISDDTADQLMRLTKEISALTESAKAFDSLLGEVMGFTVSETPAENPETSEESPEEGK